MSQLVRIYKDYALWIEELSQRYRRSQIKAATHVNSEMLQFYWSLGKDIVTLKAESRWGEKFIANLSSDLKAKLPEVKGLSETSIGYAKRFYLLYSEWFAIHPQVGGELQNSAIWHIPWGHHKYIIDKFFNAPEKAMFFVQKTLENGWSRNILLNFMDTDLYERQGKAISNFKTSLPAPQSDLAQEMTKDPYKFDFLAMTEGYREKELKDALEINIRDFLLELGTGFAYMGREYRIIIGQTEKFVDMLFYNLNLRCYVVVEIKTGKFESEYIGQLGTYVSAVNHIMKKDMDNPTLGLLICKSKDNVLAQYALESSSQPIGISEYELSKLYPTDFKGTLPSIEDIENELK
ncbi:MAG: DUF1016 family protein [Prevotella sp.]|nr:DUF1016 family protein [Prevotella sp.]